MDLKTQQNSHNIKILNYEIRSLRRDFTNAEKARLQKRLVREKRFLEMERNIQQLQEK